MSSPAYETKIEELEMKLRALSLVLFAACGGDKNPIVIVDAPDGGGPAFLNSANDMVFVSFGNMVAAARCK